MISHSAAAAIHGFWGVATVAPELTLPPGGRRLAGVTIHRSVALPPNDVMQRCGVKVTSPIRTLIDIAPFTNEYVLARIIDEGAMARLWTAEAIGSRLAGLAESRRAGVAGLRRLVAIRLGEGHPDSVLEQRIFRVLKGRVPAFVVHHHVELGGRILELDMAWPDHRIAGEVEGRRVRLTSRTKFDSDRLRSNLLLRDGWREVHLTAGMDDTTLLAQVVPLFPSPSPGADRTDPLAVRSARGDNG